MDNRTIANKLVVDLGNTLTVPEMALNEQNYAALLFDNSILLNIEYDDMQERMLLYIYLGELPPQGAEPLLRQLLAANFFWYRTQGATLSLEEETNGILLSYAHQLQDLDSVTFEDICNNFVLKAEEWKKILSTSIKNIKTADGSVATEPESPLPSSVQFV